MTQLQVEYRAVSDLIPYARNARTHDEMQIAQIAASIKEFGFCNPILIAPDKSIVAGHGRALAAAKLGLETVPTIQLGHLTETQRKAYVLADNRLALNAGWDTAMLSLELLDLKDAGADLGLLGFGEDELAALMTPSVEPTEGLTDPDDVPDDAPTRCKPGDVWVLGAHRLMCGDSTNADDVAKLMAGETAELCFTSPPYADQREYNGGKELSTEHLATFIRAAYGSANLFAVNLGLSRKGGEINAYWDDYIKEARGCGLKLLSWNVWDRTGSGYTIGQATAMFTIDHEWIFVFGAEAKQLNRTVENKDAGSKKHGNIRAADGSLGSISEGSVRSHRQLGTVVRTMAEKSRLETAHPAMFPVALPEAYIEACTDAGQAVYEPFTGSGSTLIACEKTGRRCFGMEIDPRYCSVIIERWCAFTGKMAYLQCDDGTQKSWAEIKGGQP